MADEINYMDISTYQDLMSGSNISAVLAVIEEIKEGTIYIVTNNGLKQRLTLDENDNLILQPM